MNMVCNLIQIDQVRGAFLAPKTAWRIALAVASHLQIGQEFQLQTLFRRIIFSERFVDPTELAMTANMSLMNLSLDDMRTDGVPDGGKTNATPSADISVDASTLAKLCQLYEELILSPKSVEKSRAIRFKLCYSTTSQTLSSNGETILPSDWQYLPLLTLMNKKSQPSNSASKNAQQESSCSSEEEIQGIGRCLLWVHVVNQYSKESDDRRLTNFSASLRISRLATVFLAAPDLFLDPTIHKLTKICLLDTLSRTSLPVKFEEKLIPGIESFAEFQAELIEHFESVSYGDRLFALMILVPLTARNSSKYRIKLWADNRDCLRNITLKTCHLPDSLKVKDFEVTNAASQEPQMTSVYLGALLAENVHPVRNQLLFQIALVNVKAALKNAPNPGKDVERLLYALKQKNSDVYAEIMN